MNFENLKKTWEAFAQENPMWAILTAGKERNYQWDPDQFYRAGVEGFDRILHQVKLVMQLPEIEKSLDFGCGVGRLTFPLAKISKTSFGVDVSDAMISMAEKSAETKEIKNCNFIQNTREDLTVFENDTFDFIVSMMVLQHMEPKYFTIYMKEFLRILKPDGVLVFQLPHEITQKASYTDFDDTTQPEMEIYGMNRGNVIQLLESANSKIMGILEDECCGPNIRSFRYIITKSTNSDMV